MSLSFYLIILTSSTSNQTTNSKIILLENLSIDINEKSALSKLNQITKLYLSLTSSQI